MDMTKDIMDFERKSLDSSCGEQFEPSDYTMVNAELAKQAAQTAQPVGQVELDLPLELAKKEEPEVQPEPLQQLKEENRAVAAEKPAMLNEQALTPPPRPLTSSEVVGHSEPSDPELQIQLTAKKSRSLPVSPQPLVAHNLAAIGLFEFGKTVETPELKPKMNHKLLPPVNVGVAPRKAAPSAGGDNQQFCLRWNNYQSNLTNVFDELLQNESFVDVTLACDGQSIKAHKMVLSACSPYFQALFYDNPCQHPIIIMRDVNWCDLKALVEFMYKGEINVCQDQINPLLKVAETLKIRGLAEVGASSTAAGLGAAAMLPEQRMSVYDDEEDEDELAAAAALLNDEDEDELLKPKRARLLAKLRAAETALDLNQRQRKRSRDGSYATPSPLRSESPSSQLPLAMTTSTIVRNPFASPNPQTLPASSGSSSNSNNSNCNSSSNSSSTATAAAQPSATNCSSSSSAGVPSNGSSSAAYRSPPPPPPPPSSAHSNGSSAAGLSSPTGNKSSAAAAAAQSQLPPHMAAAVAAAAHHASANVPPPPPGAAASMHHHAAAAAAQQLAAQHQLAHSHAAMASVLGASLAAAAAGGAAAPGSAAGAGNAPSSVGGHHDDMEIKPEIAEMIREEERVS
ncbi:hypothetical protein AWZ03_000203 [Drosophila navojoa]|uniref:BTB domain-containing protein n=1 Tax=Drosophila navojoa TaxID=7232 RepID=A0A484BX35_DRONA|nr:hypothetical protein AWZ03_000203 [Drosophila navojoa]